MMSELSPSGQPIHRHRPRVSAFESARGDPTLIEGIDAHLEAHLGAAGAVWHQIVSDVVHVDVHVVSPHGERPFTTLVSSGMGERPMAAPQDVRDAEFAELMLCLPGEWSLGQEAFADERNYWPVRLLQQLAALPHLYETWLWEGHTVPNGDPAKPYAEGTDLCCALLLPPLLVPEGFRTLELGDRRVHFWAVVPIHEDEMRLKLVHGTEALVDLFDAAEVSELLNPGRPSVAASKRPFGLF